MILFTIQRREDRSFKGEKILEFHSIKHKNGGGACIWNVKREVADYT